MLHPICKRPNGRSDHDCKKQNKKNILEQIEKENCKNNHHDFDNCGCTHVGRLSLLTCHAYILARLPPHQKAWWGGLFPRRQDIRDRSIILLERPHECKIEPLGTE